MKYLVTYDIANDKRRTKLADILSEYGARVNYSVFEIELNETKKERLLTEITLKKLINKKYDSLPSLIDKVAQDKEADRVNRYVTLLCARQLLRNSGFTDKDIYDCLKQGTIIRITIFEA